MRDETVSGNIFQFCSLIMYVKEIIIYELDSFYGCNWFIAQVM